MMNPQNQEFLTAAADYREVLKQFDATVEMFRQHPSPGNRIIMATWAGYLEAAYKIAYDPIYA